MVVLQSQQLTSNTPVNVIFEYIQDLNNLKTAFNKVAKDWSNTNNTIFFRFAFIFFSQFCFEFEVEEITPHKMVLNSFGQSYAPCKLIINLTPQDSQTQIQFLFETVDQTFQDPNCHVKKVISQLLEIFCTNLHSQFD